MRSIFHFMVCFMLLAAFTAQGQNVLINEIVYSNNDIIADPQGEFSDWVEIYNPSNSEINLLGYGLSDNENDLHKWIFPNTTIAPQGFVVVFANGSEIAGGLEANFKLDASGESLYLSDANQELLDSVDDQARPSNRAIGRIPDGGNAIGELLYASPGESNADNNIVGFSVDAGFYEAPVSLVLSSNSGYGDQIFYTLDGSIPSEDGMLFTSNIALNERVGEPNYLSNYITTASAGFFIPETEMFKINVLKVASFRNGIQTSPVYTKSYLIDEDIFGRYPYPIISLVTDEANFFSEDEGIYVAGENFDPSNSIWTGNYFMRGEEWERDVHIEFFEENGDIVFRQDAGVRIHGGRTRGSRQKSLKLYAREAYGFKNFNAPIFPEKKK